MAGISYIKDYDLFRLIDLFNDQYDHFERQFDHYFLSVRIIQQEIKLHSIQLFQIGNFLEN